jgi:hypothetical protein
MDPRRRRFDAARSELSAASEPPNYHLSTPPVGAEALAKEDQILSTIIFQPSTPLRPPQRCSRSDFQRDHEASRALRLASEASGASPALMNPCPAPG